jgi:hypothetical protein
MRKSELLRALQTEIQDHNLSTFMHEKHKVVMTGCSSCRKHFGTVEQFTGSVKRLINYVSRDDRGAGFFWSLRLNGLGVKENGLNWTVGQQRDRAMYGVPKLSQASLLFRPPQAHTPFWMASVVTSRVKWWNAGCFGKCGNVVNIVYHQNIKCA